MGEAGGAGSPRADLELGMLYYIHSVCTWMFTFLLLFIPFCLAHIVDNLLYLFNFKIIQQSKKSEWVARTCFIMRLHQLYICCTCSLISIQYNKMKGDWEVKMCKPQVLRALEFWSKRWMKTWAEVEWLTVDVVSRRQIVKAGLLSPCLHVNGRVRRLW